MDHPVCQLGIVLGPGRDEQSQALSDVSGGRVFATLDEAQQAGCGLIVHAGERGLEILAAGDRAGRGVRADFESLDTRTDAGSGSRRQPLGRAIGRESARVVDATAGVAGDTFILACMGYDVIAIERSAVLAAVVWDGLSRARELPGYRELVDRIELRTGDAREIVNTLDGVDVIYIDPMFPPKRKASAKPPKPVQIIRALVGDDDDATELVEIARNAARRVVVKRPVYASPLIDEPSHVIESKLVRYDVYLSLAHHSMSTS